LKPQASGFAGAEHAEVDRTDLGECGGAAAAATSATTTVAAVARLFDLFIVLFFFFFAAHESRQAAGDDHGREFSGQANLHKSPKEFVFHEIG
jgi:hypothetical protein